MNRLQEDLETSGQKQIECEAFLFPKLRSNEAMSCTEWLIALAWVIGDFATKTTINKHTNNKQKPGGCRKEQVDRKSRNTRKIPSAISA